MESIDTSPELSTYDKLLIHLESKKLHDVNNKILTADGLNTSIYKQAIPYILNKLNNLYNIVDGTEVEKNMLSGIQTDNKFKQMVDATEQFKQHKLNTMVDSIIANENINWCLMHGREITKLCTVPENVILVFLAPTNRYLKQYIDSVKNIFQLIKDNIFVSTYLKNANCVKNNCVKYATVLYPGQKYFDLRLSPHKEADTQYHKENGGFYKKKGNYFLKGDAVKFTSDLIKESNNEPSVYFIYACRATNMNLPSKLVEVLYYNEYICNYINKYIIECPPKDEYITNTKCAQVFAKQIKRIANNNVPEFSFSPIKNEDKFTDIIYNLIEVFSSYRYPDFKTSDPYFDMVFYALEKLAKQNEFFKYIIALSKTLDTYSPNTKKTLTIIYSDLFKKTMCIKWMHFIDTYFFNTSNNLIYATEIENLYYTFYESTTQELLQLILGEFIIYYFYTANPDRKKIMSDLFTKIINSDLIHNQFPNFIEKSLIVNTYEGTNFVDIRYIITNLQSGIFISFDSFNKNYELIKTEFINNGFFTKQTTPTVATDKTVPSHVSKTVDVPHQNVGKTVITHVQTQNHPVNNNKQIKPSTEKQAQEQEQAHTNLHSAQQSESKTKKTNNTNITNTVDTASQNQKIQFIEITS